MLDLTFTFSAKLWLYNGKGAWHFVTLPTEAANGIRFLYPAPRGFRPIPVTARINGSKWKTSVFPHRKSGSYLLAVKAAVRNAERIAHGDDVEVEVHVAGL